MPILDYEQRKAEKIERLKDAAERAHQESSAAYKRAYQMQEQIPLGQPILVGHHSEGRHRRHLEKIDNAYRRGNEENKKAEHYENRIDAAQGNGVISSDDPAAVVKLKEKLAEAQKLQDDLKQANKIIRQEPKYKSTPKKLAALISLGMSGKYASRIFAGGGINIVPDYSLRNNNARISSMKKRLARLIAAENIETTEQQRDGFEIVENAEENRVQIVFLERQSDQVVSILRSHGFVYSRRNTAWQRHLNQGGRNSAQWAAEKIEALS